jgi:formate dehydrogenase
MAILTLVRNQIPAHEQIIADDWNVAEIARNAFDLEGKVVGTVGCGRIGYRVLQRLQGFDCKELLWFDYTDLPPGEYKTMSQADCKTQPRLSRLDVSTSSRIWSRNAM